MTRRNLVYMKPGSFVWHEVASADPGASRSFYAQVFAWRGRRQGERYIQLARIHQRHEIPVAGIVPGPAAPPVASWRSFIEVASLDAHLERARAQGGRVVTAPADGPMGKYAVLVDPTGAEYAVILLVRPAAAHDLSPGRFVWHQLLTNDLEAALRYYANVFDWRRHGPPGGHAFVSAGEVDVGVISQEADPGSSLWVGYVQVEDVTDAALLVEELGARVDFPPTEVSPLGKLAIFDDPQGATFGIINRPFG